MGDIRNYILFVVVIFSALLSLASLTGVSRAGEFAHLEGDVLIFEERVETRRFENVPEGLTVEQAVGLVNGNIPSVRIEGITKEKTVSIFPPISVDFITEVREVTYESGWHETASVESIIKQEWSATINLWFFPLVLVGMILTSVPTSTAISGPILVGLVGMSLVILTLGWSLQPVWSIASVIIWLIYAWMRRFGLFEVLAPPIFAGITQLQLYLLYMSSRDLAIVYGVVVTAMLLTATAVNYIRVWMKRTPKSAA